MAAYSAVFGNYTHTLTVTETTVEIPNNRSLISRSYSIHRNTSAANGAWGSKTLTGAAGTTFSVPVSFDFRVTADLVLNLGDVWIGHAADGSASVSASATWPWHTAGMPGGTVDGTLALTTIPRNRVKVGDAGVWKTAEVYVGVNGEWKMAQPYVGVAGEWKLVNP